MKYKWSQTSRTKDLTITIVARDLVRLHYPFVESFISTLPLGCKYVVGNASLDDTKSVYQELSKYAPIEFTDFEWPLYKQPGFGAVAIGICTDFTLDAVPTEHALNVQAAEVLCDDAIEATLLMTEVGPREYHFRHFYGNMDHGGPGCGGYPHAPRIVRKAVRFNRTDGWVPNDYGGDYPKLNGWINRYGYCWVNTFTAKEHNKVSLYFEGPAEPRIFGLMETRKTRPWSGGHPACVQHLTHLDNYDVNYSLDYAKKHLLA